MIQCAHDLPWEECSRCGPECTCTTCRVERPKAAARAKAEADAEAVRLIFAYAKWGEPCDLPLNPARIPGVHPRSPCPCGAERPGSP